MAFRGLNRKVDRDVAGSVALPVTGRSAEAAAAIARFPAASGTDQAAIGLLVERCEASGNWLAIKELWVPALDGNPNNGMKGFSNATPGSLVTLTENVGWGFVGTTDSTNKIVATGYNEVTAGVVQNSSSIGIYISPSSTAANRYYYAALDTDSGTAWNRMYYSGTQVVRNSQSTSNIVHVLSEPANTFLYAVRTAAAVTDLWINGTASDADTSVSTTSINGELSIGGTIAGAGIGTFSASAVVVGDALPDPAQFWTDLKAMLAAIGVASLP